MPHSYPETRNDSDFLIMPPSMRPISAHLRSRHGVVPARYIRTAWQSPKMNQSRCSHHHSPSIYSQNGLHNAALPMLLEDSSRPISMSGVSDSLRRIFLLL